MKDEDVKHPEMKLSNEKLLWFLSELEQADDYQLEYGSIEVFGEDERGNEGSAEISINEIATYARENINALIAETKRLNAEITYVDQKVKSATECHSMAVQILLNEALHRTHFTLKDKSPAND